MIAETGMTGLRAQVSSKQWRSSFLAQIESIPGFLSLVEKSREQDVSARYAMIATLDDPAQWVIRQYSLHELRVARHFYNTEHLLAFWRHYHAILDAGISKGLLPRRFPLPSVKIDADTRRLTLEGMNLDDITGALFLYHQRDAARPATFARLELKARARLEQLSEQQMLDSLRGRLAWVAKQVRAAASLLYTQFLWQERHAGSELWDWYKIHVFLDHFLYYAHAGDRRLSRFDLVFFSNNKEELAVWLEWELGQRAKLGIRQVRAFLDRQTRYNARVSQQVSLAENDIRNSRRGLLAYDPCSGVVKLSTGPGDILADAEAYFQALDIRSLGCPFGREKGIAGNALVELYEYQNGLFARAIEASWEFQRLFGGHREPVT